MRWPGLTAMVVAAALTAAPAAAEDWTGEASGGGDSLAIAVARNEADWAALWARIGREPPKPLGDKAIGVGVFDSLKPSGGHGIGFAGDSGLGGMLVVQVRLTRPAPTAMVTQAMVAPWAIRLRPAVAGPVGVHVRDGHGRLVIPDGELARLAQDQAIIDREREVTARELERLQQRIRELQDDLDRVRRALPPDGGFRPN